MQTRITRSLLALAAGVALAAWLGARPKRILAGDHEPYGAGLATACQDALAERVGGRGVPTHPKSFQMKKMDEGQYRLVSHFDQGGGRTRYACDATLRGRTWEVTELTLVRW